MREPENFSDWSDRKRIEQEQWDRATEASRQPIHPKTDDWFPQTKSEPWRPPISGGYGGGYSGGGDYTGTSNNLGCLPIFVLIPAIAVWPLLYAAPVALGFVVGGFGYGMLEAAFDVYRKEARLAISVVGAVVGFVTVIFASRLDHRLAKSALWRWPRHLIRLALFAGVAHLIAMRRLAPAATWDDWPVPGRVLLNNPVYLAGLAAVVVVAHVVLTRKGLRDWWHERMEALKLRPA